MQRKRQSNERAVKAGSVAPRGGASLRGGPGGHCSAGEEQVPSSTPAYRRTPALPDYTHPSHTGGGSGLPDEKAQGGVSAPHSLAGRPPGGGDSCPLRPGPHCEPRKQGQPLEAAVAVLVATPLWGSGETGSSAWAGIHMPLGAQGFSLFRGSAKP